MRNVVGDKPSLGGKLVESIVAVANDDDDDAGIVARRNSSLRI
jgi:hypothetical protein